MGALSFYSAGDKLLLFATETATYYNDSDLSIEEQIQALQKVVADTQGLLDVAHGEIAKISKLKPAENTDEHALLLEWESFVSEAESMLKAYHEAYQEKLMQPPNLSESEQETVARSGLRVSS